MDKISWVEKIYSWMETLIYEDGFKWSPAHGQGLEPLV